MQPINSIPDLIVVVDDNLENRELAKIFLRKLGWRTQEYACSEQALVLLEHLTPAAILLDIKMPGMGGIELAQVIRRSFPFDIRIVGYTAHALNDEVQCIKASGFDEILIKPVTFQHIGECFGTNQMSAHQSSDHHSGSDASL